MSADQNKLAYSGAQNLSISPDGTIGTPALQGSLSDPSTSDNIFFSEPSVDSRARRARARDNPQKKDAVMQDRRSSPRLDVVLKVRFERKEDFQEALIHNISQMGVYLATDRPFDVGYQFLIEIDLPNDKGQIKGKCEVVWVNQVEAKDYPQGMGVQFVELKSKHKKLLEEYLKELGNA